jgi:hypothetical protein
VLIAPVVVFRLMPPGQVPLVATVALPPAPKVAATPLTLSLAATLATGVDATPAATVPLSGPGKMLAVTVIVSTTVAQFGVVALSQS